MSERSKAAWMWGMALVGVGLLIILVALISWVLLCWIGIQVEDGIWTFQNPATGLLCFGPFALLGAILFVVGSALWWANRH